MNRRSFLRSGAALAVVGSGSLAGCTSLFTTGSPYAPPLVQNRPDAVYIPSHKEGMNMAGMSGAGGKKAMNGTGSSMEINNSTGGSMNTNGPGGMGAMNGSGNASAMNTSGGMAEMGAAKSEQLMCALTYSYPHRFWTIEMTNDSNVKKVTIKPEDTVHLMVSVWDAKTGVYMMDTSPTVKFAKKGEEKNRNTPWVMLSQNMGFHAGDNVSLSGEGTYSATVEIPAVTMRKLRGFEGKFTKPTSFDFTFEYSKDKRDEIPFQKLPERKGKNGAIEPMKMKMMPLAKAPETGDLPGRVLGQVKSDAVFVVTAIEDAAEFGAKEKTYLAVSARTPYNGYVLPSMSLSGTLTRNGKTIFDDALTAALDPELDYHYGAMVDSVESGDKLELTVDAPPQVARHEGYETAFFDMSPKPLTVE